MLNQFILAFQSKWHNLALNWNSRENYMRNTHSVKSIFDTVSISSVLQDH